ncbi:MAG: response regulator [Polyangiaceae bacterium]|nr:response regulator [Polyangiaceae bacterium]
MGEIASRVLVVDDDESLRCVLAEALGETCSDVRSCPDARSALELLESWSPEVMLLDVALPDGTAFDILASLSARLPVPAIVAMSGVASPEEAFRLSQVGVRCFLSKPFDFRHIDAAIAQARTEVPDLRSHLRGLVGQRSVQAVESEVRAVMVEEALARSGGSRRGAASLLRVSRQALQYMLRQHETDRFRD